MHATLKAQQPVAKAACDMAARQETRGSCTCFAGVQLGPGQACVQCTPFRPSSQLRRRSVAVVVVVVVAGGWVPCWGSNPHSRSRALVNTVVQKH